MNFVLLTGPDGRGVAVNVDKVDVIHAKHDKHGMYKHTELLIGVDTTINVRETPQRVLDIIKRQTAEGQRNEHDD